MKFIVSKKFRPTQFFRPLFLFTLLQCASSKKEPYIYKSLDAEVKQFPYIAFVENDISGVIQMCTATLVTETQLLCAAHCFMDGKNVSPPENITIYLGLTDRKKWEPDLPGAQMQICEDIAIPATFDFKNMFHDVAILKVKEPFLMTEYVQIAEVSTDRLLGHGNCTIIGWGYTGKEEADLKLRYASSVKVKHISEGCGLIKKGDYLCVMDQSSSMCDRDSGGPLMCEGKVRGVASYGESFSNPDKVECGNTEVDIYKDLSTDVDFLHEHGIGLSTAAVHKASAIAMLTSFTLYTFNLVLSN